jgi:hypothetical protein
MATRFLLGSFEACVAPTFIAIVQMWYRRGEQTVRNAAWYAQLGVVNIVGQCISVADVERILTDLRRTAWKPPQLRASPHRIPNSLSISDNLPLLRFTHRYVFLNPISNSRAFSLSPTDFHRNSALLRRSLHLAPRLPDASALPHPLRKTHSNRTPTHEPARNRLGPMALGPRLGMPPRPQDVDLDSAADSRIDPKRRDNDFRALDRAQLRLLELPSDPVQHAVRGGADRRDAGRGVRCYALESEIALFGGFVRAADYRTVDFVFCFA